MFATKVWCLLALLLLTESAQCFAGVRGSSNKLLESRADPEPKWIQAAAIAQKRRNDALNAFMPMPPVDQTLGDDLRPFLESSGLLSKAEYKIVTTDATVLIKRLKNKEYTSLEVTKAFCKATVIAQNLTNCVTEVLFEEAFTRAKALDDHIARTGQPVGPLHGLPISLKDTYMTPPHPSSIGIAAFANQPTNQTSVMVDILHDLGAVFYVKTNVPTGMLMPETINNVWGETVNPIHKKLSPGGSSGGEGALLAMRGSPLGVGTDIGGSVRIPSAFTHLYGLKPSFGRFPTWLNKPAIPGQDLIFSVSGPMATSLKAVRLFAESIVGARPWNFDPKMIPMPWKQRVVPRGSKLKFGIYPCNDGYITCHPPVERALKIAAKALRDDGHQVVDWVPISNQRMENFTGQVFSLTASDALLPLLKSYDEPLIGVLKLLFPGGDPPQLTAGKLRELIVARNQLQKESLDQWQKTGVDGIIAPVAVQAAARLQTDPYKVYGGFTAWANVLDLPGCTFPVTYADKNLDPKRGSDWTPNNQRDGFVQSDYDADFWHGAPVGLQVVGPRLNEEKVVDMTEIIADILSFRDRVYGF